MKYLVSIYLLLLLYYLVNEVHTVQYIQKNPNPSASKYFIHIFLFHPFFIVNFFL